MHATLPQAGRREWLGLAVLMLPTLLIVMDVTVLHLAVPWRPSARASRRERDRASPRATRSTISMARERRKRGPPGAVRALAAAASYIE